MHVAVAILRVNEGLDYSAILGDASQLADGESLGPSIAETPPGTPNIERHSSFVSESPLGETKIKETKETKKDKSKKKSKRVYVSRKRKIQNKTILNTC